MTDRMDILAEIPGKDGMGYLLSKESIIDALSDYKKEYPFLIDLSGVDFLGEPPYTEVIYFLYNPKENKRLRLSIHVKRGESTPSCISVWPGAAWYERELYDLFGVHFAGHHNLSRILMPDDWQGHPLRRDYALGEEAVQFKNNVEPKLPSTLIPHAKAFLRDY